MSRIKAAEAQLKFLFHTPGFFFLPFKKMLVETSPIINRTYFIYQGKIVAVAGRA